MTERTYELKEIVNVNMGLGRPTTVTRTAYPAPPPTEEQAVQALIEERQRIGLDQPLAVGDWVVHKDGVWHYHPHHIGPARIESIYEDGVWAGIAVLEIKDGGAPPWFWLDNLIKVAAPDE